MFDGVHESGFLFGDAEAGFFALVAAGAAGESRLVLAAGFLKKLIRLPCFMVEMCRTGTGL